MINPEPPPNGFSTGKLYGDYLRVYKIPSGDRIYWIYDYRGFLASATTLEELDTFLSAQSSRPPGEKARDLVDPEWSERLRLASQASSEVARNLSKQSRPMVQQSLLSLEELGL